MVEVTGDVGVVVAVMKNFLKFIHFGSQKWMNLMDGIYFGLGWDTTI